MKARSKNAATASGFRTHKSYSPEEIWAAGGTTAFGKKMGQSNKKIVDALKRIDEDEPFTEDEWKASLKMLREGK